MHINLHQRLPVHARYMGALIYPLPSVFGLNRSFVGESLIGKKLPHRSSMNTAFLYQITAGMSSKFIGLFEKSLFLGQNPEKKPPKNQNRR
jgi:hypothetical protein